MGNVSDRGCETDTRKRSFSCRSAWRGPGRAPRDSAARRALWLPGGSGLGRGAQRSPGQQPRNSSSRSMGGRFSLQGDRETGLKVAQPV
ncbi:unnamed protein product [Caretta caretta]